jgi:peptide-methionine (R)-S-oxide reductase
LFSSSTKFDSGSGWPSFDNPVNRENVELKKDSSYKMTRTEVICKNCGSHWGMFLTTDQKKPPGKDIA